MVQRIPGNPQIQYIIFCKLKEIDVSAILLTQGKTSKDWQGISKKRSPP